MDWGWYTAVASAVERRVWLGDWPNAILPNLFTLFISGPGVGKGLVLDRVKDILAEQIETIGETKRQIVFLGPDSTTYADLTQTMAAIQRKYTLPDGADYTYPGITFVLDEFLSLLNRDGDDLVTFLLEGYNGKPHFRSTKHQGKDRFKRCSVNLIAGTTPDQLQKIAKFGVFSNGLSSRMVIVYDPRRGGDLFSLPSVTPEWKATWKHLSYHIFNLTQLFGGFTLGDDVRQWVASGEWSKLNKEQRENDSARLDDYYARRNLHIQKLAMLSHLSEDASLTQIGLDKIMDADAMLRKIEAVMHIPLVSGGRNELASIMEDIVQYIANTCKTKPGEVVTYAEILAPFIADASEKEIEEMLKVLTTTGRIKPMNGGFTI